MDVIFETGGGASFCIEVGYFDTVLEIKEKIFKFKGIPTCSQALAFQGILLEDTGDVESCAICHNSHIHLLILDSYQGLPEPPKISYLLLRVPFSTCLLCVAVNLNDSVLQFKHKLHQSHQGLSIETLRLYMDGKNELQDDKRLTEYGLSDGSEIEVLCKPLLTSSESSDIKTPKTDGSSHAVDIGVLEVGESFEELEDTKAKWQRRRYCCWLYLPGEEGELFGSTSLYCDLLGSAIQVCLTVMIVVTKQEYVHFDYAALLLALFNLVSLLMNSWVKTPKCEKHQCKFECPECKLDSYV